MTAETYRTYARMSWEDKLRSLSPEALACEREKTFALVNFWKTDRARMHHYSNKLALIDEIMEARR